MRAMFMPALCLSLIAFAVDPATTWADTPPTPVLAVEASAAAPEWQRTLIGRIAARRTVDMAFEVPGRLIRLHADEGATLAAGAPLAELDPVAFTLALEEARVSAEQAQAGFERMSALRARGVTPETSLEEARAAHELRRIAVRMAERDLALASLSAPFEAMVAQRLVPENSLIQPGTAVLRLHDISEWRVTVSIPEGLMRLDTPLDQVRIEAVIGTDPVRRVPLIYRENQAQPDPVAQTFLVTFTADLPPDSGLLPGMAVTVEIGAGRTDPASGVAVPVSALVPAPDGTLLVWRISGGRADPVPVEVAGITGESALVASGLVAGDVVITAGQTDLMPGQPVRALMDR
ncbi:MULTISPECIES: efflux RND transporter periplasmic adaptor subunit [unclassified Yoonia]|uniref:efflux RND transporter periplasmic adaptor subunit n=1 Tax=unclassified Yoonia TaxID=2629118 RepID=UPI002AFE9CA3|nr:MULTISPECIES: efflux RND transporter periplasmic adaptor subunit [unclassified Yoonia]